MKAQVGRGSQIMKLKRIGIDENSEMASSQNKANLLIQLNLLKLIEIND
jgi:hypothetical protein